VVTVNGQASDPVTLPVTPTRPGLFPRVFNQDFSVNSASNPVAPGGIIVLYATGQGVTRPASRTGGFPAGGVYPEPAAFTTVRIGGVAAETLFQGQAPGTAGVMQINARIPLGIASGDAVPIQLSIGAGQSQTITLAVR
jgi:uncharacterized protein (TIGR03437 family)